MTRLLWLAMTALLCLLIAFAIMVLWPVPARADGMIASWYGGKHHGRRTASGERFNMHALTCAHRTARFGTVFRVSFRGRATTCRVNDRGPFVRGRSLDLSAAAARAIGCNGVCRVSVSR